MVEITKDLFNSPQGKDLLAYWAKEAFIFTPTFVAGDPHQTDLNEGSRRFVLSIIRSLNLDMDQLIKMAEHNQNDDAYTT